MAQLKGEVKRAFLSSIARSPNAKVKGLRDALSDFQDSCFAAVKSGKMLASTSGAGHSAMFSMLASMPPDEVLGFSQELIEVYTDAANALGGDSESLPDEDIVARMVLDDRMQSITRYQSDFTGIRIPQTAGGPT